MNIKFIVLVISVGFSLSTMANVDCEIYKAKTIKAYVVKVDDGDTATVKLKTTGNNVKVRFYGADTSESEWEGHWPEQPFSAEAKLFTTRALANKNIDVSFTGEGTYSRCVGEVFIDGKSHSLALIKGGYAWWYSKYAPNRVDLEKAQELAKRSKSGLWANPKAQAPWDFRYQHNQD